MLVEKEPKLSDKIVTIKLVSGEEILAYCVEENKRAGIKIKQPIMIIVESPRQKVNGKTKVNFEPWMLGLPPTEVISLRSDHILYIAEAGENAITQYLKIIEQTNNVS